MLTAIGKAGECGIACVTAQYHKLFWVGLGRMDGDGGGGLCLGDGACVGLSEGRWKANGQNGQAV